MQTDFYFEFSPYQPLISLPKGAYLGQLIVDDYSDTMYRIVRNGSQVITAQPQPVDESFSAVHTAKIRGAVGAGRNIVPLDMHGAVEVDVYRGGRLTVFDGEHYHQYHVQTNSGKTAGDGFINLTLTRNLITSIVPKESPQVLLTKNPYSAVVPSTVLDDSANTLVAGFSVVAVPKEYYFLALVRGISVVTLAHDITEEHRGQRAITKVEPLVLANNRIARVGLVEHPAQQTLGHLMEEKFISIEDGRDTLARLTLV